MDTAKKLALGVLSPLFIVLLFATAFDFGVIRTAGNADSVKHILNDTGIYNTIVPDALAQAKTASGDKTQIPLNQTVILNAAGQAFTPQIVKNSAENTIDVIYHWLDGKTPTPDFRIDLTQVKSNFAAAVGQAAQQQADKLPVCPTAGVPDNFDPFGASCLPRGMTPAQAAILAQNAVNSGRGFLEDPVITADNLKSGNGQPVFGEKLKGVPPKYQLIKKTPFILSLLALLVGTAIVFLSSTRQKGLRRIGTSLLIAGILMLVFSWALNYGVNNKALPRIKFDNNAVLQKDVVVLIKDITKKIDKNFWFFGGFYSLLGAGAIGAGVISNRGGRSKPLAQSPVETAEDDTPSDKPKPTTKPPAKRNIKVQ